METHDVHAARKTRALIARGLSDPVMFRRALLDIEPMARDAWVDAVLGLGAPPDDGPDLPRGCTPYLPCSVDALLRTVDLADVGPSDVFVDVGSGVGRAAALVHLLTGAPAICLEIQRTLARRSRALSSRFRIDRVATIQGDASTLVPFLATGTVFFMYCPFSGQRLASVLDALEPLARARPLSICCLDLPVPPRSWLALEPHSDRDLALYRTTAHDARITACISHNRRSLERA